MEKRENEHYRVTRYDGDLPAGTDLRKTNGPGNGNAGTGANRGSNGNNGTNGDREQGTSILDIVFGLIDLIVSLLIVGVGLVLFIAAG